MEMLDSEYYDELEVRDPDEREFLLFEALGRHLRVTKEDSSYFGETFKDIGPEDVKSRADLPKLPITRKSDLAKLQSQDPPLAGMTNIAPSNFLRLYQSPGPTYEGEAEGNDWWRLGRAMYAAGIRPGDIIMEVAQQPVHTPDEVEDIVRAERDAGRTAVLLQINRGGQRSYVGVRLAAQ